MEAKWDCFLLLLLPPLMGQSLPREKSRGQPRHFQYSINSFRSKGAHSVDRGSHLINDTLMASKNLSPVQRVSLTHFQFLYSIPTTIPVREKVNLQIIIQGEREYFLQQKNNNNPSQCISHCVQIWERNNEPHEVTELR